MTTTPTIPSWELDDLDTLGQQGSLYGLTPNILGAIDQAESSGEGGGINSSGYGGWFGLGETHKYPGGTPTSALLSGTTPNAFADQAQISASEFASLLPGAGTTPVKAEQAYQTGSPTTGSGLSEGAQIMSSVVGTGKVSATTTSILTYLPFIPGNTIVGQGVKGASGDVGDIEHWGAVIVLVLAGLGVMGLGLYKAASPNGGAAKTAALAAAA